MASFVGGGAAAGAHGGGPLSVCVDATTWYSYTGGVMDAAYCGPTIVGLDTVNHCAQVVGVDTAAGWWLVRNSWGE